MLTKSHHDSKNNHRNPLILARTREERSPNHKIIRKTSLNPHPCCHRGDHKSHQSRIDLSASHQNAVKVAASAGAREGIGARWASLASCNATMRTINKCNAAQDQPLGLTRHRACWSLRTAHVLLCAGERDHFRAFGFRTFCTFER
jgi:hypothetical protein